MRPLLPDDRPKAILKAEHTIQPGSMAGFRLTDEDPASGD